MFEIPFSELDNGIKLCSKNIRRFIQDAELLLNDSSIPHAMVLAIFAFEELGKYHGPKKAKETAKDYIVKIDERLFGPRGGHQYKQDIARGLIPSDSTSSIPAYFDSKYLDARYFQTEDVNISPILRLDSVFVNWKDGVWVNG